MADNKVIFEVITTAKGVQVVQKQTENLAKSTDKADKSTRKLTKSRDKYNRTEKGAAGISSNATKNFSKMQQSIDGGGGTGGLVRAYALLAANVFALSAAFGVLSRSAQIDTLTASIEQLEIVSGKSIKSVARNLQEASGFGLSFAESLRSVSLASSAGFGSAQIEQLGSVARNAAVSLGRNLPDALDRIFRGVIKVEPELLDEIGLFVRVNEASAKYASTLGIAVGDLTEFQKRQAFLNEAVEQGTTKFEAFQDVPTDAFAKLGTTFADVSQEALSLVNKAILPLVAFLAENKLLFTTVFAAVAATLAKLAIPAMGAFTQSIAENAVTSAEASRKAVKNAELKGAVLQKEHKQFMQQEQEKLQIQARAIQAQQKTPVQLSVRGRDASKRLEQALVKQELGNKARIEIITQRINDIETNRGLKQRQKNKDIQAELALLKEELNLRNQALALETQINSKKIKTVLDTSVASRTALEAQGKAIRAAGIANIATIAETRTLGEALRSLGSQLKLTAAASKEAGISFGFLRKGMFLTKGAAVSLGIAAQGMWQRILGPLQVFLFLLPLLQLFAKSLGFGSKAAEELSKANTEAEETFDILGKRLDHVSSQLAKLGEDDYKSANKGIEAFKNTLLTSADALDQQIKAFEKYQRESNYLVYFFGEVLPSTIGLGTEQAIQNNVDELIKGIDKNSRLVTPELRKLVEEYEKASQFRIGGESLFDTSKQRDDILKQLQKETKAYVNLRSAIDGTKDAARAFSDSLIIKTDVDKPLASFRQINSSLANSNLTAREIELAFKEIANDTAILTLLTEDQRREIKASAAANQVNLRILQEVEDTYFRQQEIQIRQKQELAKISAIQKEIKDVTKVSLGAVEAQFALTEKQRKLEAEALSQKVRNAITATGLTEETLRELSLRETLLGIENEYGLEKENIASVQAALNALQEQENFNLEETFRLATLDLEKRQAKLQAELEILNVSKSLNDSLKQRLQTQAELEAFSKRGSLTLTPQEELKLIKEQEALRIKGADARLEREKALAKIKYNILQEELNVLMRTNELELNRLEKEAQLLNARAAIVLADKNASIEQKEAAQKASRIATETYLSVVGSITESNTLIRQDIANIGKASKDAVALIQSQFNKGTEDYAKSLANLFQKIAPGSTAGASAMGLTNDIITLRQIFEDGSIFELKDKDGNPIFTKEKMALQIFESQLLEFANTLESTFGESGAFAASLGRASANLVDVFVNLNDVFKNTTTTTAERVSAVAGAIASSLGQLSSVFSAYMKNNIQEIDNLIDAEKKRDGKSKESVEKLRQLEAKKEAMKRKEFETNKKIMLAQAVASTAAAVAGALALIPVLGPYAIALASLVGAMGVAQIAIISKLKYNGGTQDVETPQTALSIGKRSNAVDVSQQATGGELNYLRGGRTTGGDLGGAGRNLPGGAMGRRGYANGGEGILVGERGPEIVSPSMPVDITPNYALGGQPTNVNFNINAVDAAGVEDVLMNQRGNIIRMIREAANENGERFLETIDTQSYGSRT